MFSPFKNLITYIQKNASSNSIFGGNSTTEVTVKMETENTKTEKIDANMEAKDAIPSEICKEDDAVKDIVEEEENVGEEKKACCLDTKDSDSKCYADETTPTIATENSCDYQDDDGDDDIEEQIGSSIMLKTPVKVPTTNSSEILELKKPSNATRSIFISHDLNRNQALTPIDDELEDFRHDPMEVLQATSSACLNPTVEGFCSLANSEETENIDFKSLEDLTEDEADGNKTEDEQKPVLDSDLDVVEEKDIETENEHNSVNDIDDEDEPFLELDHYKRRNVVVIDEIDLNASTASIETNNTTDDPLAIACEEQEAFAADKTAALEELNLLNTSQASQDEDTRTTTDEDLQWLKTDLENNQPSCSSSCQLKDGNSKSTPEKEERNGEGSDSGLGSETSALHITVTSITDTSQLTANTATSSQTPAQIKTNDDEKALSPSTLRIAKSPPKPQRSNLKRRLDDGDDVVDGLNNLESASSLNERTALNGSMQKKPKRSINFDNVQVYYFPRQQGFSCVPSAGGCTLGMGASHIAFKTLTLAEHAAELRRAHRLQLQEIHPRGSSSEDSEESEEDYLSEGSGSDLDGESNGFLQPVSPKQRRALLKAAGIRKIDPSEKAECRNIRNSREVCGCSCRDFCDPETCACSQSGIKCQVDRDMFPCGCSRDACGNTIGRVEFNPTRVRTHYIHTLMRLEMENRQQQNPYSSAVGSALQPTPSSYYQTHLQPQSNYSSGYASPAYNTASEMHHQSAASSYFHTQSPSTSNSLYGQQTPLEMAHNNGANSTTTTSHYGIDSLDAGMFGGPTPATSAYGELLSVGSYHYGNLQTQESAYNSYHNTPYLNTNNNITSHSTSNSYSSCAVPSIPPFGTATTTEATGVYHSVSTLSSLETTTAPSCNVSGGTTSLDASTSFISLSTPLASSSRLSQINDLLQHNRNTTTALVAVSQNVDATDNKSVPTTSLTQAIGNNSQAINSSLCSSISIPPIEDAPKSCTAYAELDSPPKSTQIVSNIKDYHDNESSNPSQLPETIEPLIENVRDSPVLKNSDILPQTSLNENVTEPTILAVSATIEPSSNIEVAASN